MTRAAVRAASTGVVLAMVTACAGGAPVRDKTGAHDVVLRFATIDNLNPNGQQVAPSVFLKALEKRSGGHLRVTVEGRYGRGSADAESQMMHAIEAGELDGGWPASRSIAAAGIRGLEPLEAPFVLTNHAAAAAVTDAQAAGVFLHAFDHTDIVAIGLATSALRRPFANRPLRRPADWQGVRVRSYSSVTQDATYRALGAVPVAASYNFPSLVQSGQLDAAETDIAQYDVNNYLLLLPIVMRNVVLWPKTLVFCVGRKSWDRLTRQERTWLREAASDAAAAAASYHYDEDTPAQRLCRQGVRFLDVSQADLAALRRATASVTAQLTNDPVTGPGMRVVKSVAQAHPGVDVPKVSPPCQTVPAR